MPRFCYVNGRYLPHRQGFVHIEDRGYQFADGVYEVIPVYQGRMIDAVPHLDRLDYSLGELRIAPPMARKALELVIQHLMGLNGLTNGLVYLQVTRGVAPRDQVPTGWLAAGGAGGEPMGTPSGCPGVVP